MLSREKLSLISLIYSALFNSYWCSCYVLSTGPFTLEPVWDFTWATLTFTVFSFYMLLFLQPLGMVSDIVSCSINILKENKPSFIQLNNEWIVNKYSASMSFWFGQGKQKLVWNIGQIMRSEVKLQYFGLGEGYNFWFKLSGGSKNQELMKSGFHGM